MNVLRRDTDKFGNALIKISIYLSDVAEPWAITGSCNLWMHSIEVIPHDIDIVSTKTGVYLIQNSFYEFTELPVEFRVGETIRSYYGKFDVSGVPIDVMGDPENLFNDKWIPHNEWKDHIVQWMLGPCSLPVLRLDYEYLLASKLGQAERMDVLNRSLGRAGNSKEGT